MYGGVDLRSAYNIEAAYAPYALRDKLIFVARRDDQYFVVYDGQRLGPAYDRIHIAYCCEPAATSAPARPAATPSGAGGTAHAPWSRSAPDSSRMLRRFSDAVI